MSPVRQRFVHAALRSRSESRKLAQRGSAVIQRRGPIHRLLRDLYRFSRRHPVSVNQWDAEYAADDYTERLDRVFHVAHHAVILGYLTYGSKKPTVLDVGCGHGRLLRLLVGLGFAEYVGVDWSSQAVERARSLSIPHTRFEVADMDEWDTTERFDAIVLNNSLSYSIDPREMFERALGWLAEDGFIVRGDVQRPRHSIYLVSNPIRRSRAGGSLRGEGRFDRSGLGRQGVATSPVATWRVNLVEPDYL